jgi:hypothetical protein
LDRLAFLVPPSSARAGATLSPAVEVALQDAAGNILTKATGNVSLTLVTSSGAVLGGSTTVQAVAGVATFSDLSVSAVGQGYQLKASVGAITTQSAAFDISAGDPATLLFLTQPQNAAAGAPLGAIRIACEDATGNLDTAANGTVTIALGAHAGSAQLLGGVTANIAAGIATFSNLSLDQAAGGYVLSATAPSFAGATSNAFTISAAQPSAVSSRLDVVSRLDAGPALSSTITVTALDAFSNPVSGQVVHFSATGAEDTLSVVTAMTNSDGVATATLSSPVIETKTVTAQIGAFVLNADVTVASANASSVHASPMNVSADGVHTATLTVVVLDTSGAPMAGQLATFSVSGSGNQVTGGGVTNAQGTSTATLTSTKAETKTITVLSAGIALTGQVTFLPGAASATTSRFLAEPSSVVADGVAQATIAATLVDADSNPLPGVTVTFGASGSANGWTSTTAVTNGNGVASVNLSSTVAETKTVTAQGGGVNLTAQAVFVPGAASAATSVLSVAPTTVLANGVSTCTAQLTVRDAKGNPVPGLGVNLSASGAGNTLVPALAVTNAQGIATATLASSHAEAKTITARFGTQTLTNQVTFSPAPAQTRSQLVVTPTWVNSNGVALAHITVTVRDGSGVPYAGQAVSLTVTGSGNTLTPANGSTNSAGTFSAQLSSTVAESKTITATIGSFAMSANVLFAPSCAGTPTLGDPPNVPVPGEPIAIVAGDFNQDGKLDFATAAVDVNAVYVALGYGNGRFHPVVAYTVASGVVAMIKGDFNGDFKTDIATLNAGGNVSVLLGTGDGNFMPAINSAALGTVHAFAAGDLNHDGALDLVVAGSASGAVTVLLGSGGGAFGSPTSYATGGKAAYGVAVANLNGDGHLDVAVVDETSNQLVPMLGDGSGRLTAGAAFSTPFVNGSLFVVAGDLNVDGKTDLVVTGSLDSKAAVYLGNGDGTFAPAVNTLIGTNASIVHIIELDGDGKPDLLVPDYLGMVSVLRGNGDGTFANAVTLPATNGAGDVAVGDVNGDGRVDLLVTNAGTRDVSVMLSGASGLPVTTATTLPTSAQPVGMLDLDGDGKLDLVAISYEVAFAHGNGDGSFASPKTMVLPQGYLPTAAFADFDGDGALDMAAPDSNNAKLDILLGKGDGTFKPPATYPVGKSPSAIALADFNGDGATDVVVVDTSGMGLTRYLGVGDGTVTASLAISLTQATEAIFAADFNSDGWPDLVAVQQNGAIFMAGDRTGGFLNPAAVPLGAAQILASTVGDLNQDGKLDLLVVNGNNNLLVLNGNGDGTFGTPTTTPVSPNTAFLSLSDLDGNGTPDVLLPNNDGTFTYLPNQGGGVLRAPISYLVGYIEFGSAHVLVGDLDGDGRPDVVNGPRVLLDQGCLAP